jgi:isopentenyl phosphate kinase
MKSGKLVFLKLGGAAITDKSQPRTALPENINSMAAQISRAYKENPHLQIILGHGSGSFGHYSGQKYGTRNGVKDNRDWLGFAEVWDDARQLNELVLHAFLSAGLPVIAFPPSAWVITENRIPVDYFSGPIHSAVQHHLMPVVNGDVIFDKVLGGTILSTEEVFSLLADELHPDQIILASREPGVWQDFPKNTKLSSLLSPLEFTDGSASVHGSAGMDVTGGMAKKVAIMLDILKRQPNISITITGGMDSSSIYNALVDKPSGTLLQSEYR